MSSTPSPSSLSSSTLGWRKSDQGRVAPQAGKLVQGCPRRLLTFPQHEPSLASSGSSLLPLTPHTPCPILSPSLSFDHPPAWVALPLSLYQLASPPSLEAEHTVTGTPSSLEAKVGCGPDPGFQQLPVEVEPQRAR